MPETEIFINTSRFPQFYVLVVLLGFYFNTIDVAFGESR